MIHASYFAVLLLSDPCQTSNGGCDVNAACTNESGGITCECHAGYTGDGFSCIGEKIIVIVEDNELYRRSRQTVTEQVHNHLLLLATLRIGPEANSLKSSSA
jgi:EGF domain